MADTNNTQQKHFITINPSFDFNISLFTDSSSFFTICLPKNINKSRKLWITLIICKILTAEAPLN